MQFVHNQTSSLSPYLYTLNFKCTHTHTLFQDITVVKTMKSPPAGDIYGLYGIKQASKGVNLIDLASTWSRWSEGQLN